MNKQDFLKTLRSPLPKAIFKKYPEGNIRQFWGENPNLYSTFYKQSDEMHYVLAGHTGVDIATFFGDDVLAMHDGTVAAIQTDRTALGGLEVLVVSEDLDDNGIKMRIGTFYAHLDSISVVVSQKINRGDIIGLEGNTGFVVSGNVPYWGNAPAGIGTHLHLGLYEYLVGPGLVKRINNVMGGSSDPLPYLEPTQTNGFQIILTNMKNLLTLWSNRLKQLLTWQK